MILGPGHRKGLGIPILFLHFDDLVCDHVVTLGKHAEVGIGDRYESHAMLGHPLQLIKHTFQAKMFDLAVGETAPVAKGALERTTAIGFQGAVPFHIRVLRDNGVKQTSEIRTGYITQGLDAFGFTGVDSFTSTVHQESGYGQPVSAVKGLHHTTKGNFAFETDHQIHVGFFAEQIGIGDGRFGAAKQDHASRI